MDIKQCFLTQNDCYKSGRKITPTGIVIHSTGANNSNLRRYVQPDDGILGVNNTGNHWNQGDIKKCVHAFIGRDKNGTVKIYQTLPWTMRCWGCGSGKKGSYNNGHIQFEICEDGLANADYFNEVFSAAAELCAYLCKKYNIPVSNIVSHHEAYMLGYASNHGDCDHWLKKFGKNMGWFRSQVSEKNWNVSTGNISTGNTGSNMEEYNMPTIKRGSKGKAVKIWQIIIGVNADGSFGPDTERATKVFQDDHGLYIDGVVGKNSWKAGLNSV